MSEICVRMDPLNPGQFFACCGLLELINREVPGVPARFALEPMRPRTAKFIVLTSHDLKEVLARLRSAKPEFPDQEIERSIRPVVIPYKRGHVVLDWWLDVFREGAVNLKCWAGQVTTENLFSDLLPRLHDEASGETLFEISCMTKAKLGVDPRSAWNALDFGFSPNEHAKDAATFATVEILAAIGLQGFRPQAERRDRVSYCLWHDPLPSTVARLAFRAPWPGLRHSEYVFSIAKRGQSYKYFTFAANT